MSQHPEQQVAAPWQSDDFLPLAPGRGRFGYKTARNQEVDCSLEELESAVRKDTWNRIRWVWTPASARMLPTQALPELATVCQQRALRLAGRLALIYLAVSLYGCGMYLWLLSRHLPEGRMATQRLLVLAYLVGSGILPMIMMGLQYRRLSRGGAAYIQKLAPNIHYFAWMRLHQPKWTFGLIGALAALYLTQIYLGHGGHPGSVTQSVLAAGMIKSRFFAGEWWRLLTAGFLHGNPQHFFANALMLWITGWQVERLGGRGVMPLLFLVGVAAGNLLSAWLSPVNSIGASSGIAGLLGFLIVFGWHYRRLMPARYLRGLLVIVALNAAFGIWLSGIVDNYAHLGGLLGGLAAGWLLVVRGEQGISLPLSPAAHFAGRAAEFALPAVAVLTFVLIARN